MKLNLQYISILAILLLLGCEDYYEPDIENISGALVVEAMLTDQKDILTVKLSRTTSYNEATYYDGESNAEVFLLSTNGESYTFYQSTTGYYKSEDSITAQTGEFYYLHIITEDGDEYMSEVEEMMPPCTIDTIQLTDSTELDVEYDSWGDPYTTEIDGIYISVLPSTPERSDVGFLYQWRSLINYYVYSDSGLVYFDYYCWLKKSSSTLYVYDYNEEETGYSLILDNLHFLSYDDDLSALPIDSSRFSGTIESIYTSSFYYHLKQYTVTESGAEFWKSVKAQSEASGKLFDPVEEEISTNIYCTSDTSKSVYGYFNTASYSDKIILVKLSSSNIYSIKTTDDYPVPTKTEDCLLNELTEFWY